MAQSPPLLPQEAESETDYTYNALDDLTRVDQWGVGHVSSSDRVRTFTYDSLSRLLTSTNPETGAICYGSGTNCANGYDANGNLPAKTDARGITTTYAYDLWNRLSSKHYSDNTPSAFYSYDVDPESGTYTSYPVGREVFAWTSQNPNSTIPDPVTNDPLQVSLNYHRYDSMGRYLAYTSFDTNAFASNPWAGGALSLAYDLAGDVTQINTNRTNTDGNGEFWDYAYDPAGRLDSVTLDPSSNSIVNPALPTALLNQTVYSPIGLQSAQLAINLQNNDPAIGLMRTYDKRLRTTSASYTTGSGASAGSGVSLYSYGVPALLTYDGVGDIKNSVDTVIGEATAYYDHINRLSSQSVKSGNCNGLVTTWTYDVYGNRNTEEFSGSGPCDVTSPPSLIYNVKNQVTSDGYIYDNGSADAGNVTYDGVNSYAYDAEGRLCAYKNGTSGAYGIYLYDADGARVAKGTISSTSGAVTPALCNMNANSFSLTTTYTYDPSGNILQEFSGNGNWLSDNIFAGGKLLASYSGTLLDYAMSDWVGTKRAQISSDGNLTNLDYFKSYPFGDGFAQIGSAPNATDLQFTGKEQDAETSDNIDFGARYYGPLSGRFLSPDFGGPMATPDAVPWADFENPQSLNLYGYVNNNPLSNVDDDGHDVNVCDNNGQCNTISNEQYTAAQQANNGGLNVPTLNQVGMNGNGSGQFNSSAITDSNGNTVGSATYVSNGGADYYANRNGLDYLGGVGAVMNRPSTYAAFYGASALGGAGLVAAGATAGELTLLGDISLTPTSGETAYAQRLLAQGGKKSVEKAINTLTKRLAEHQAKVGDLAGNPGSVQREIAGFTRTIEALKQVLR